ncbi:polyprenyl synthetase family protein [Chromobacterium violaceum]|uniref:polyprenyl synthetase family protein n=1 Tax=Chromobacterium violaceum TaxID=536 RepID=UPI00030E64CB|nr:polyprenyl synthetase family protein [Chromobacterium violaceum]SUX89061.1 Farnesyl diphosphate synthase [Chromobacterium violaceum]
MNGNAQYSDDFLADMAPALAQQYRRWYPWCRETVLATIDRLASRPYLETALGARLSEAMLQAVKDAWLDPYRSYHNRMGKMLRPFLVCSVMQAFERDPRRTPVVVAIAEIIHAASLVLDDVADDSPLRRGGPTAHRQVGVRVAGAAGSAWLNACFQLLAADDSGLEPEQAQRLADEIAWEHWVTGVGTTIDTTWPWMGRLDGTPAQYLQSVVHRSTSYTYRLPLKLGAIAAGASPQQTAQFAALGEELGIAFQIIDDILNVQPGDDKWGKALAEDITQGKINLQVLLALERLGSAERARLVEILQSRTADPQTLAEAVALMAGSGAFDAARDIAQGYIDSTQAIVAGMDFLNPVDRERFSAFVDYVIHRNR